MLKLAQKSFQIVWLFSNKKINCTKKLIKSIKVLIFIENVSKMKSIKLKT